MINLNNINRDDIASLRPDIQKQWINENYIMFNALYFNNELFISMLFFSPLL